jgi:hypothetical protein
VHDPPYVDVGDEKPDFAKGPFPWRCAAQFDDRLRTSPTEYMCMLFRTRMSKEEPWMRETFLILEPCSGTDAYRRVGIGYFTGTGESSNFDLTVR